MTDDRFDAELATLRMEVDRRFAEADEKQKARNPNIISAIRIFVNDISAYVNGTRTDFPREALIGVFGAWLRPRLVLILGSIIATMIASGEFGLIYRQNDIMRAQNTIMTRQNELMEQQTRLSNAQALEALMPALRTSEDMSTENQLLLTAHGDVLVNLLLPAVKNGLPERLLIRSRVPITQYVWLNSAKLVMNRASALSTQDRAELLMLLLDAAVTSVPGRGTYIGNQSERQIVIDDETKFYIRVLDSSMIYLYNQRSSLTLSADQKRTALRNIAAIYTELEKTTIVHADDVLFAHAGFDQALAKTLCPRLSPYPTGKSASEYVGRTIRRHPNESEPTVSAVLLYLCAPELLDEKIDEDVKIKAVATSALALIESPRQEDPSKWP